MKYYIIIIIIIAIIFLAMAVFQLVCRKKRYFLALLSLMSCNPASIKYPNEEKDYCRGYLDGTERFAIDRNKRGEPQTFPGTRYRIKKLATSSYTHDLPIKIIVVNGGWLINSASKRDIEEHLNITQSVFNTCGVAIDFKGVDYIRAPYRLNKIRRSKDTATISYDERCIIKPTHTKGEITAYFVRSTSDQSYAITRYWHGDDDLAGAVFIIPENRSRINGGVYYILPHEIIHVAGDIGHADYGVMANSLSTMNGYLSKEQCRSILIGGFAKPRIQGHAE